VLFLVGAKRAQDVLSSHEDLVTADLRVDDLSDDVLVGEADDQAVLGRIVLVLRLGNQPLTGIVIGCAKSDSDARRRRRWHLLFPSLRRLYFTWYREKYASFLTSLDFFPESAIGASNPHSKQLAETLLDTRSQRGDPHDEVLWGIAERGRLTKGILTCC
jgi:hypothetical protein